MRLIIIVNDINNDSHSHENRAQIRHLLNSGYINFRLTKSYLQCDNGDLGCE